MEKLDQSEAETSEIYAAHPLIEALLSLNLPPEDYAVFGSGPMYAHGINPEIKDLDLVARGAAWNTAAAICEVQRTPSDDGNVIRFPGPIEIFDSWAPGEWDINELIDKADMIGGIKFVQLETVLAWKKQKGRPKDVEHIRLIEEYLKDHGK